MRAKTTSTWSVVIGLCYSYVTPCRPGRCWRLLVCVAVVTTTRRVTSSSTAQQRHQLRHLLRHHHHRHHQLSSCSQREIISLSESFYRPTTRTKPSTTRAFSSVLYSSLLSWVLYSVVYRRATLFYIAFGM